MLQMSEANGRAQHPDGAGQQPEDERGQKHRQRLMQFGQQPQIESGQERAAAQQALRRDPAVGDVAGQQRGEDRGDGLRGAAHRRLQGTEAELRLQVQTVLRQHRSRRGVLQKHQ
jgi:hypothetical protein